MQSSSFGPAWKPTKPIRPPHRILFFDTETLPTADSTPDCEVHRLRLGHALCREFVAGKFVHVFSRDFFSPQQFAECVEHAQEHRRSLWVVCHNANFDWRIIDLVGIAAERGWSFHSPSRRKQMASAKAEGKPGLPLERFSHRHGACFVSLWIKGRRVEWLDSLNWYPFSASALGEMVGSEKLPQPGRDAAEEEWLRYCRRDVEIIADACCRWIEGTEARGWGAPKVTLAGTAAQVYRTQFLRDPIYCPDSDADRDWHRRAYYGGRVEVRRLGMIPERIQCWDVTSLYPAMMAGRKYPGKLLRRVFQPPVSSLASYLRDHCVIAEVDVDTATLELPLRIDGRLRFCTGQFHTHLAGPELEQALAGDCIRRVHRLDLFEPMELFSEYVNTLFSLRKEAAENNNAVMKTVYKLLMNSLYGKFGQKGVEYRYWIDPDPHPPSMEVGQSDSDGKNRVELERFGPVVREAKEEGESRLSHPAIAAYVTSYGRVYLEAAKRALGENGFVYSDTDSLFVLSEGPPASCWQQGYPNEGLGSWQLAVETAGVVIHGKKDYEILCPQCCPTRPKPCPSCPRCGGSGIVRTIKGVRRAAEIVSTALGVDGFRALGSRQSTPQPRRYLTVRQLLFHSLAEVWHSGWAPEVRIETVTKVLSRVFRDGDIMPDGTVKPFHLRPGQWEDCQANPKRWHDAAGLASAPVRQQSTAPHRRQRGGLHTR